MVVAFWRCNGERDRTPYRKIYLAVPLHLFGLGRGKKQRAESKELRAKSETKSEPTEVSETAA